MTHPTLYTFRRCPYAIRARMALHYAQIKVRHYEVELKNKPPAMLKASPKGTVPVLVLADGSVLEQSLDIMLWALSHNDPDSWFNPHLRDKYEHLINLNDFKFKPILDHYKYAQNSNEGAHYRNEAILYFKQLNSLLVQQRYLINERISFADIALFPFIRQFYMVDQSWFEQSEFQALQRWLSSFLDSALFLSVMKKQRKD